MLQSVHIYVGANEGLLQWIVEVIKVTISPYIYIYIYIYICVGANEGLLQWIVDIIKVTISPYICRRQRGIITVDCIYYKGYNLSIYMSAPTRDYYSGL